MAITPIAQPEAMRRIGGGRGSGGDDFAGLGGSFAGPGSEFTGAYLQNRISGMNRATVSPRVNQRRVMASPEFALAKTLGISTPYNSGGNQVDIQSARQNLNNPYSTRMDREAAQGQMDKFNQAASMAPRNPVMAVAGLAAPGDAIQPDEYAGPTASQSAFDRIQERFGKPQQKIAPVPTTPGATGGGAPQPMQGAPSGDQAAVPMSPQAARDATKAPIGAELPATSGEPESRRTPTQETTKGPRLDTYRGPNPAQATGNAGTFKGGQEARAAADANRAGAMSPQAQMQGANAYRKQQGMGEVDFAGQEPKYDQAGINETNARQGAAVQAMGNTRDAGKKMAFAEERNKAQDDREAIKKGFNEESELLASNRAANERMFGNPYGPDGGESFRQKEKAPELAPLGGYDEKIVSGARGGNPDAKRGEAGYMEKETVAVGPMTNKPASSQAEYDQRTKAFADAGEKQEQDNADAAMRKKQAGQQKNVDELNKKYAGRDPIPRRTA
jgi:hypothetical protein